METTCAIAVVPRRLLVIAATLVAARALALPLPFSDDFEADAGLARWTGARVSGLNAVSTSERAAWTGGRSLEVTYAGDTSQDNASVYATFDSSVPACFVRFHLLIPTLAAGTMAADSNLRVARLGGPGSVATVVAELRKSPAGNLFLTATILHADGGSSFVGGEASTPLAVNQWQHVAIDYEPARVRLVCGVPSFEAVKVLPTGAGMQIETVALGVAGSSSPQRATLTNYYDEVAINSTGAVGPAAPGLVKVPPAVPTGIDGGSDGADGGPTGGDPGPGGSARLVVGCGCRAAPIGRLLALWLVLSRRRAVPRRS